MYILYTILYYIYIEIDHNPTVHPSGTEDGSAGGFPGHPGAALPRASALPRAPLRRPGGRRGGRGGAGKAPEIPRKTMGKPWENHGKWWVNGV